METHDPYGTPEEKPSPTPGPESGPAAEPAAGQAAGPPPAGPPAANPRPYGPYLGGPYPPNPPNPPGSTPTFTAVPEPVGPAWWTPRRKVIAAGAALALALGGGLAGGAIASVLDNNNTTLASPTVVQPASNKSTTGIAAIAKAVSPSVVSITVPVQGGTDGGSGIILRSDGTILTNNHVVSGASQGNGSITVKFSDGKTASASVVGTDPVTDLAVIKASGVSGLQPATLGNSDQLQVGDGVVAIGSPLGLDGTVTSGIISALHRTLNEGSDQQQQPPGFGQFGQQQQQQSGATIGDAIQTDAPINPGNSGGALVNSSGQVIGINTAIATSGNSNGNIGVGFAIPINTAKQVADQLITSGKATHAFLGVTLTDATGGQQGALLTSVQGNSPAAKAGLKEGDLIIKVDGTAVDGAGTLSAAIRGHKPGDRITLTYIRGGQTNTVTVSLAASSGS